MNGTLYVLAAIATPAADAAAAPADPWASVPGVLIPALAAGVIGYLVGFLRDASKTKAERKARHGDEILAASTEIMVAVHAISLAKHACESSENTITYLQALAADDPEQAGKVEAEWAEYSKLLDKLTSLDLAARSPMMKLSVLAPELDGAVDHLMRTPWKAPAGEARSMSGQQRLKEATEALAVSVRNLLKVQQPKVKL